MILVYTNSDSKFNAEIKNVLNSVEDYLSKDLLTSLKTVQFYNVEEEDRGCVFQIFYPKEAEILTHLASNLVTLRLEDGVKYVEVEELENETRLTLITTALAAFKGLKVYLQLEDMEWFTLSINSNKIVSIEDVVITKVYNTLMYNTSILSLSSIYITRDDQLDTSAFYMFLSTLIARFLESASTCSIRVDFQLDREMLQKCLKQLLGRKVSNMQLDKILTYTKYL